MYDFKVRLGAIQLRAESDRGAHSAPDASSTVVVRRPSGSGDESTSHMFREELFSGENVWVGVTQATAGESGWHHHGDMDTYIYVLEGRAIVEYGPGGKEITEVIPGSAAFVAKGVVHRDINPGPGVLRGFLVRVGTGPDVVNVSGPDGE